MAYHRDRGEQHRTICLIPESAHGTNAASAQMAGLRVVTLPTDKKGCVPMEVFKEKVKDRLSVVFFFFFFFFVFELLVFDIITFLSLPPESL